MRTQDSYLNKVDSRLSYFIANIVNPSQVSYQAISRPSYIQVALWCLALGSAIWLALISINKFQLGIYNDDAYYVVLARSLVQSNYFGLINLPGLPVPTQFPFGFPLLLSPFVFLFPGNLEILKALPFLATILNGFILFWEWPWFNLNKSYWWGLAVSVLYLISPLAQGNTRSVMSEPVFTTFCLVAILLGERAARKEENRWWAVLMSLVLVFVVFTRTVGVILPIIIFGYLLYTRGLKYWRQLALVLSGMVIWVGLVLAITPINLSNLLPSNYLNSQPARIIHVSGVVAPPDQSLNELPSLSTNVDGSPLDTGSVDKKTLLYDFLIKGTLYHFREDVRQAVLPFGNGAREQALAEQVGIRQLPAIFGYLVSALVLIGYLRLFLLRKISIFALFGVLYLGVLELWVWQGPRLLYPIQPQLLFGFLAGLEAVLFLGVSMINQFSSRQIANLTLAAVVLALVAISFYKDLNVTDSRLFVGDLQKRTTWLRANLPKSSVVLTEDPEIDYLNSGNKTVPYPPSGLTVDDFEAYLSQNSVNYILVAPEIAWQDNYAPSFSQKVSQMRPLFDQIMSQHKLVEVYSSPPDNIEVYQYQP
jgi:hypothetical protein